MDATEGQRVVFVPVQAYCLIDSEWQNICEMDVRSEGEHIVCHTIREWKTILAWHSTQKQSAAMLNCT